MSNTEKIIRKRKRFAGASNPDLKESFIHLMIKVNARCVFYLCLGRKISPKPLVSVSPLLAHNHSVCDREFQHHLMKKLFGMEKIQER